MSVTLTRLDDVHSPELGNRRDVLIALPPSYAEGDRHYPVVYMQDGQNLFDPATSFAGDWALLDTLAQHGASGLEAIVVGIPNMGNERKDEYGPFPDVRHGGGRGEAYGRFLVRTLKPLVDREFRTRPERAHTAVVGSSLGGLVSLYAFLAYPETFGAVAALSPSLWFARGAIFRWARPRRIGGGRVYLDAGAREPPRTIRDARRMRELLIAKGYVFGVSLRYVEDPEGGHDEASWARRFRSAFPFLVAGRPIHEGAGDAA
ncbi:MAG TPA: alpha/beta hydrolase-fold protein [Gemmatimonadales bacterium]|nr:alpha/beta hydrolase-fold protein [Gemmatimonadales bacterium]